MKHVQLAPSILSADFSAIGDALELIAARGGSLVHLDVMDGHFVPQVTFGQPVIASLRPRTALPFDVHLMVDSPERCLDSFIAAGADYLTFHWEATAHADLCVDRIRRAGRKAGVAINPATPVCVLEPLLPLLDLVLVMTVNPGWAGQKLIPYVLDKVRKLADVQREKDCHFLISVDGGVNPATMPDVVGAGADIVVSGSSFFNGDLQWQV